MCNQNRKLQLRDHSLPRKVRQNRVEALSSIYSQQPCSPTMPCHAVAMMALREVYSALLQKPGNGGAAWAQASRYRTLEHVQPGSPAEMLAVGCMFSYVRQAWTVSWQREMECSWREGPAGPSPVNPYWSQQQHLSVAWLLPGGTPPSQKLRQHVGHSPQCAVYLLFGLEELRVGAGLFGPEKPTMLLLPSYTEVRAGVVLMQGSLPVRPCQLHAGVQGLEGHLPRGGGPGQGGPALLTQCGRMGGLGN
jgi:hypothetical protein